MKAMRQIITALMLMICVGGYGQCGPYTLTAKDSTCTSFVLSVSGASAAQQIIWDIHGGHDTANRGPIHSGTTIAGGNGQGSATNQLYNPWGIYLDALGNIYVSDYGNNRIQKFPAGSTSLTNGITVAGGNGAGSAANQIYQPACVYIDGSGNLYVADAVNERIQKFPAGSTSATNGVTVAGGNGYGSAANQIWQPQGVYIDASGNIYVADANNYRIQKFPAGSTSATNGITVAGGNGFGTAANQLAGPVAVYVDVSGNIYVAEQSGNRIHKFPANSTSDTIGIIVAGGNGQGGAANQLASPNGVYVDVSGNIYVADASNGRIQKFPPTSTSATNGITVAGGNGSGSAVNQLHWPYGVYVDVFGSIYVSDNYNNRIQKWLQPLAVGIDTSILVTSAGPYSAIVKDTFGCVASSDTITQPVILTISNTSVTNASCPGGSDGSITEFITGGTPGYTYHWSTGTSFSNILNNLSQGSYCFTVTDGHACTASLCDSVGSDSCTSVWPGDADNNRIVNNADLLAIGLAFDSTGPVRAVQGIVWQGDAATDWVDTLAGYSPRVNFKHADCNGDGIINSADTVAIMANFSLTHAKTSPMLSPWRNGIPAIKAVISPDTAYNGDTLTVTFVLGDTNTTVNNFYGLAFTYNFDTRIMDSTYTPSMDFLPTSWIGTPAQKISINKIFTTTGQVQAAVTRINHTGVSGYGPIAKASFRITTDNISGKDYHFYTNKWSITDVTLIDQSGHTIPLNAGADTSTVGFIPTGIREITTETLHIQPNPARDRVLVSAGNAIRGISLTNIMGQQVMDNSTANSRSVSIDISGLDSGVYFVHVKTEQGTGIAKLIIEK